jgi:hypothetical protein
MINPKDIKFLPKKDSHVNLNNSTLSPELTGIIFPKGSVMTSNPNEQILKPQTLK